MSSVEVLTELDLGVAQQYIRAATFIMLLYDTMITLDEEIRLIWPGRFTVVKGLYFLNRYATPMAMFLNAYFPSGYAVSASSEFCLVFSLAIQVFDFAGGGLTAVLIVFRVYALYKGTTRFLVPFLAGLLAMYSIPPVTILLVSLFTYFDQPGRATVNDDLHVCLQASKPPYLWSMWIFMIMFETIVVGMIVYKTWRQAWITSRATATTTRLVTILLRDGLLYYGIMLGVEVLDLAGVVALQNGSNSNFAVLWGAGGGVGPSACIISLLVSRIYLNLRNVADHSDWMAATELRKTTQGNEQSDESETREHSDNNGTVDSWDI